MTKLTYLAVFEKSRTGFGVYFPDIPGCISCGDNFDHALKMAEEVLGLHLYGMLEDGDPLPERTDKTPPLAEGDIVVAVSVFPSLVEDEINNRKQRTIVTIPYWLKTAAEAEKLNYSRLLETAIKERLGISLRA
jgi:predicted RNase H-like HicB family nuclease